jgi:hypothetical protein
MKWKLENGMLSEFENEMSVEILNGMENVNEEERREKGECWGI